MKKYLLLSFFALSISQCHAIDNLQQAQEQLAAIKKAVQRNGLTDIDTLDSLQSTINQITDYAIKNSKTITGQQDENLIIAAATIRSINDSIIMAFKHPAKDRATQEEKLSNLIQLVEKTLLDQKEKINRIYLTPSKKNSHIILQDVIIFFTRFVSNVIEQERILLDQNQAFR